ncbi:hypothetical protein STEG23_036472 [Scotinomys teguina]
MALSETNQFKQLQAAMHTDIQALEESNCDSGLDWRNLGPEKTFKLHRGNKYTSPMNTGNGKSESMNRNYKCQCNQHNVRDGRKNISYIEDMIEYIDLSVKEIIKANKVITQNIQEIWDTMKRPRKVGMEEEEYQFKVTENIFNKIIEENFLNLKKEIPMKIQGAYRTSNRLKPPKKSPCYILMKPQNIQKKKEY